MKKIAQQSHSSSTLEIGITGGIGVGKSIVCKIFNCFGIPIYNSDKRAKHLISTNSELILEIQKEFGYSPCNQQGDIDKKKLRALFSKPTQLKKLNKLVHPQVLNDYKKWRRNNKKYIYIIKEAALLIEAGEAEKMNKLIVVSSPLNLRIERILTRDSNQNEKNIHNIIRNQMDEEKKIKYADYVIVNDGTHLISPQIWELHNMFLTMKLNS